MTHAACMHRVTALLVSAISFATPCAAQCFEWDTTIGHPGLGIAAEFPPRVNALTVYDEGSGPRLFVGGHFDSAGGVTATHLARWDGASWTPVGNIAYTPHANDANVRSLGVFDDGSSRTLIVSGIFDRVDGLPVRNIAAWNGTTWSALGTGLSGEAYTFATFDDGSGPALYVGGNFSDAGGVLANGIAKWDGSSWSAVATGPGSVRALCVFDDGTGPALYAGGYVEQIGGVVRYDGTSWSNIGGPESPYVLCLATHDDGTGSALYAGGRFDALGGVAAKNVAKWNGSTWSALGAGLTGPNSPDVYALCSWNDGFGPKLVAGGRFMQTTGTPLALIGAWNGSYWKSLRTGMTYVGDPPFSQLPGSVDALAAYDDGSGPGEGLFAAGSFDHADKLPTDLIARYGACLPVGQTYCFGDGSLPTPCPCVPPNAVPNPSGGSDAGCANSFVSTGGKLVASGTLNPDTARLLLSNLTPIGFGFFISGNASEDAGVAAGDGVRCAGGAFLRFGGQNAVNGFIRYPNPYVGWPNSLSQASFVAPGSGLVRHYQLVYRNSVLNFCNASTLNWTNAVTLIW